MAAAVAELTGLPISKAVDLYEQHGSVEAAVSALLRLSTAVRLLALAMSAHTCPIECYHQIPDNRHIPLCTAGGRPL
jgi:hypothetical protein